MPKWSLAFIVCGIAYAIPVQGQSTTLPPINLDVPPPAAEAPPVFPEGVPVSQPLQPVIPPDVPEVVEVPEPITVSPPPPEPVPERIEEPRVLWPWDSHEFLLWWTRPGRMPVLATGSRGSGPPILGESQTSVLIGGGTPNARDTAGMRLTSGISIAPNRTMGIQYSYLFLGTMTERATLQGTSPDRPRWIGRPIVDAQTGLESAFIVAQPWAVDGWLQVTNSSRVTGWEVGTVGNILCQGNARIDVLAGYRYFMFNEGLRIEQVSYQLPGIQNSPGILALSADQFDAHNRFHGGQMGLQGGIHRGSMFLQMVGKIAFGHTVQVAKISGQTTMLTNGYPLPLLQSMQGGVLALPSNSGRVAQSVFSVLPEAQVKIGCKVGSNSHFYIGYTFIYVSDVIRAGDQVDRTIDTRPMAFSSNTGGTLLAEDRPRLPMQRTDFWTQGISLGFQYLY